MAYLPTALSFCLWQIVAAHFHGLDHTLGDFVPGPDGLDHPNDLRFLGNRPIKQRGQAEADEQGEQDADHTDYGAVFQETHAGISSYFILS